MMVLIGASPDVLDSVLSIEEGGGKLERGLVARVSEFTQGSTEVVLRRSPAATTEQLLQELRTDPRLLTGADVVLLSVASDVVPLGDAAERAGRYEAVMGELAGLLKNHGAHVIVFNASSFDPEDKTSCYAGVGDTPTLFVQHLNRALINLSMLDGLSIIDVDRIISEIGGRSHVQKLLSYSPHACEHICQEVVRVLADYGFFEDRPLLAQVGRRDQ
jgi:hypothetical protein